MNSSNYEIFAESPNRIDLAGGTLDIYPLYLFLEGGVTVNAAINISSKVWVHSRKDGRIAIHSKDLNKHLEARSPQELPLGTQFDLLVRIVRFYLPAGGVTVTTQNAAPRGSGLGASSALLIALSGALNRITRKVSRSRHLIDAGANLEAQAIRTPTGKQDYIAALNGGIQAIHFGIEGITPKRLPLSSQFLSLLESQIILSFTGIPHFSGSPNWNMMKRFLDKDKKTVRHLTGVRDVAERMVDALLAEDLAKVSLLLDEEWQHRKALAPGVTTPAIDKMMRLARKAGALASKLCGAGGGGTMITVTEPGREKEVIKVLEKSGAQILPYKFARRGLQVRIKEHKGDNR